MVEVRWITSFHTRGVVKESDRYLERDIAERERIEIEKTSVVMTKSKQASPCSAQEEKKSTLDGVSGHRHGYGCRVHMYRYISRVRRNFRLRPRPTT